jgi:hypothetical protein
MMQCLVTAGSQAVGVEAALISRKEAEIRHDYYDAPLTGAPLRQAVTALTTVIKDAAVPNWDCYGAAPINMTSVSHAFHLLSHMPADVPAPEISADPDGEVSIEWYRESRHVFSVSVSPAGTLSYAGIFGKSSVYGTEDFVGEYLPVAIRANLRRLFGMVGRSA